MNWLESLQTAIDYIEMHLLEDELITGENISNQVFSSEYNFRTVFRVITGYALGEYIRNRRLSLAGEELINTSTTVLDIAVKYGYDTAESFTKAFQRFHGVSPSYVRKNRRGLKTFTRVILKIQAVGGSTLDYSVEQMKEIRLVGYKKAFPDTDYEENNQRIPAFVQQCCDADFDGICKLASEGIFTDAVLGYRYDIDGSMWYAFGVNSQVEDIPEVYSVVEIPARKWLKFYCEEPTKEGMQHLWYRIYTEVIPCSSYHITDNETLEVSYCRNGKNERYLYMPLKEDKS